MNIKEIQLDRYYLKQGELFLMDSNTLSYLLDIGGEYNYEGVLLTKEWMLRLEFEQYSKNWFRLHNIWVDITDGAICFGEEFKQVNLNISCKYVHQIQTLCFTLINQELIPTNTPSI